MNYCKQNSGWGKAQPSFQTPRHQGWLPCQLDPVRKSVCTVLEPAHLPTCPRVSVVRKVRANPVVNVAKCHSPLWRAVDGERYKRCVGIGRLSVVVAVSLGFRWVQASRQVDGTGRGLSCWRARGVFRPVWALNLSSRGVLNFKPWQPVHSGEAVAEVHMTHLSLFLVHTAYSCSERKQGRRIWHLLSCTVSLLAGCSRRGKAWILVDLSVPLFLYIPARLGEVMRGSVSCVVAEKELSLHLWRGLRSLWISLTSCHTWGSWNEKNAKYVSNYMCSVSTTSIIIIQVHLCGK